MATIYREGNLDLLTGKVAGKSEEGVPLANKTFGDPLVKFSRIRAVLFPANRAFLPRTPPAKADDADIVRALSLAALREEAATSRALARVGEELIAAIRTPAVLQRLAKLTTEPVSGSRAWS